SYDARNRKVVQQPKGIWLYPTDRREQGRVRPHQRRRTRRNEWPRRGTKDLFSSHQRPQNRQDFGRKSARWLIGEIELKVIDHGCTGKEFWFASPASVFRSRGFAFPRPRCSCSATEIAFFDNAMRC